MIFGGSMLGIFYYVGKSSKNLHYIWKFVGKFATSWVCPYDSITMKSNPTKISPPHNPKKVIHCLRLTITKRANNTINVDTPYVQFNLSWKLNKNHMPSQNIKFIWVPLILSSKTPTIIQTNTSIKCLTEN